MRPRREGIGLASPDLTDFEWAVIAPLLPKVRGIARVDDRRILSGILWRLRTGEAWAKIPPHFGPPTTCHGRFRRWRDTGVWGRILDAIAKGYGPTVEFIEAAAAHVPARFGRPSLLSGDPVVWVIRSAGPPHTPRHRDRHGANNPPADQPGSLPADRRRGAAGMKG